jgi:hypothetical protein
VLEKILILDNLRKNIIVMEWCMCKHNGKSIDHLLLHYEVAMEVWSMVFQLFGVTWMMPGRMKDCLGSWRGQKGVTVQFCKFGEWFLCMLCGVYGEKGMHGALRTGNLDSPS